MATNLQPVAAATLSHEMGTLGCLLVGWAYEPAIVREMLDILRPEMFEIERHNKLFATLAAMYRDEKPVDLITSPEELRRRGVLDAVGGLDYLCQLADGAPTIQHGKAYAERVRDFWTLREMGRVLHEMRDRCIAAIDDPEEIAETFESKIVGLLSSRSKGSLPTMQDAARRLIDRLERPNEYADRKVYTGFYDVDDMVGGFHATELAIIAARPSVGKSAMVLQIAEHAASKGKPVLFFTLEMADLEIVARSLCRRAGVNSLKLRNDRVTPDDIRRLKAAAAEMTGPPIFLDDRSNTLADIRSQTRRYCAKHDVGLVIVDYLQLVETTSRRENRVAEVGEITRGLKRLAQELKIPIVALSQLNRDNEKTGRKPRLSDLRESGSIEQDANTVILLHIADEKQPTKVSCIVAKARNGLKGEFELTFNPMRTEFESEGNVPPEYQRPFEEHHANPTSEDRFDSSPF